MKKILITAGGTREYIDDVRYIGNISTGATAKKIAEKFIKNNYQVFFLHGIDSLYPKNATLINFKGHKDLNEKIRLLCKEHNFTAVIQCAAISDYSLKNVIINDKKLDLKKETKISSKNKEITLVLKKNFKIISRIKKYAKNDPLVIGFKLTSKANEAQTKLAVQQMFKVGGVDIVVHNDLSKITKKNHITTLFCANPKNKLQKAINLKTKNALSITLVNIVELTRTSL